MEDNVILVGWPKNGGFTIDEEAINVRMEYGHEIYLADPERFTIDSWDQWSGGVEIMRDVGREVYDCAPVFGGGDNGFKRDNGFMVGDKFVLANHASSTRRPETGDIRRIIKPEYIVELTRRGVTGTAHPGSFIEGGDVLTRINGVTPIAWGPRTTMDAIEELRELFPNERFLPLELNEPHFYGDERVLSSAKFIHGDTAAFYTSKYDLAIYRPAFVPDAWRAAERLALDHGGKVYQLSAKEANGFAANMKEINPREILAVPLDMDPEKPNELRSWLESRGNTVYEADCTNFNYADGAWNCLTQEVAREMLTPQALAQLARQARVADAQRSSRTYPAKVGRASTPG